MKVLSVSSYFLPYVSGLTIHVQRLAEGFSEKGHRVMILTNKHEKKLPSSEVVNGVLVKRAKPLRRLSRGFISLDLAWLFIKNLPKFKIVILHLPMPEAFIFGPLAKILGRKVFLVYHANLNLPSWSRTGKIIERLVFLNHFLAAFWADKIVAYSQDYANFATLLRIFKNKVVTISPPVLIDVPDQAFSRQWRKDLGLMNTKVIGFAGRFAEEKGGDLLLEAIPWIVQQIPEVKLVFAGEVNLAYEDFSRRKKDLIDRFIDRVVFLGVIPPEKMAEFYALCDVLVLPSRAECFGLVQVEAMLCGCPVVAFNIPGGRVPILTTGMGRLAKEMTPESLAETIVSVLQEKENFCLPRKTIEEKFNYAKTITAFEKLFRA